LVFHDLWELFLGFLVSLDDFLDRSALRQVGARLAFGLVQGLCLLIDIGEGVSVGALVILGCGELVGRGKTW